ncbi:HAD family hydrolase [Bacillaceae bacterium W0354]
MKWISFDLDGTLMQNPFVGHVFPELEELISPKLGPGKSFKELLVSEHNRKMQLGQIVEAYNWDEIAIDLLKEYEIDLQVNVEEICNKHCVEPKIYLLDEYVIESLQYLKKRGYQLAVVTNGYYKYQAPVLKELAIYDLFDVIITPDRSGYAKPDARILNELLERGELVAHVGDRIDHDIVMSNEEGIDSIFINRRLPEEVMKRKIGDRKNTEGFHQFLQEKWQQETGLVDERMPETGIPNKVISSTKELMEIF